MLLNAQKAGKKLKKLLLIVKSIVFFTNLMQIISYLAVVIIPTLIPD